MEASALSTTSTCNHNNCLPRQISNAMIHGPWRVSILLFKSPRKRRPVVHVNALVEIPTCPVIPRTVHDVASSETKLNLGFMAVRGDSCGNHQSWKQHLDRNWKANQTFCQMYCFSFCCLASFYLRFSVFFEVKELFYCESNVKSQGRYQGFMLFQLVYWLFFSRKIFWSFFFEK